jgi:very-short-patch-repair endonuclease
VRARPPSPRGSPIEFPDFLCRERKLIVEVDGATHSTDEEQAYDARRTAFLEEAGYRVLRIANTEVFQSIESVCDMILSALERG